MKQTQAKRVILLIVVVLAIAGMLGWSAISRGFSAKDEPGRLEAFVAGQVQRFAIPTAAKAAKNPGPVSPEVLSGAMAHFADHCASCHGNDGRGQTLIGKGLYPKPPDMSQAGTQQLTDGELYYIIENGIRWTGMPAFGEEAGKTDNKESWDLVHFIRHLPAITEDELTEMRKMNPRSPMELAQEEAIRKFLQGEDSPEAEGSHSGRH